MTDHHSIRNYCEQNSKISTSVVDDFFIRYAADREMDKRLLTTLNI